MLAASWTLIILTLLEAILGIDNLIFISLAISKAPKSIRTKVRIIGLTLALLMRFIALFCVSLILSMHKPVLHISYLVLSGKDLLMIAGGLFLIFKSFTELSNDVLIQKNRKKKVHIKSQFFFIVLQIMLIDLVFSIDSILTAIALTQNTLIISAAFALSMLVMLFLSNYTVKLINLHPNLKIIAILFITLVGIYLLFEGVHIEMTKGYLYSSFIFALLVETASTIKKRRSLKRKKYRVV